MGRLLRKHSQQGTLQNGETPEENYKAGHTRNGKAYNGAGWSNRAGEFPIPISESILTPIFWSAQNSLVRVQNIHAPKIAE